MNDSKAALGRALDRALDRRQVLAMGAIAGLGTAMLPRLALAAEARPEVMPRVRELIERWVGPGRFPGMVAALGLPGRDPEFVARGTDGFTDADPQGPDSLYRIYSMTKPVTGMAAMLLIDEGRMALDQPLADILPAYARMMVQKTYDGSLTDLVPAERPITIRHLLTHTAGLGYTIVQRGAIKTAMEDAGVIAGQISRMAIPGLGRGKPVPSLALFAERLAAFPLVYQPGATWSYSVGLDLMGRVIEVVSGKPFDVFLKERIFEPAGMTSTWFEVPGAEAGRLTTNYGALAGVLVPIDEGRNSIFCDKPPFPFGGAGLVSSPRDYDRFLRMLGQLGEIGGQRVMSERAVRMGTSNLLPAGVEGPAFGQRKSAFGAGGRLGVGGEAGIFGWAGAAGTVGTVDMARSLRSGIYVQFMPPDSSALLPEYQKALHADVIALLEKPALTLSPITFAGSRLDRADHVRSNPEQLAVLQDWRARVLRLDGLDPVISSEGGLEWGSLADVEPDSELVFLGLDGTRGCFAEVRSANAGSVAPANPRLWQAMATLGADELATYGGARSLVDWHARHRHCARCGSPTVLAKGGWQRNCTDDTCCAEHFPRVDPVTIMLVEHDGMALLGRQPRFPAGSYSALAGFVEPGESIEEAVAREVLEEAGVRVRDVRYVASQPWPFPSSLMIGCHAMADDPAITIDATELEDARWFSRSDVADAIEAIGRGESGGAFRAPPRMAIANHLLRWWIGRT